MQAAVPGVLEPVIFHASPAGYALGSMHFLASRYLPHICVSRRPV